MLAFKLVSKALYKTTLDQQGGEVVDIPKRARTTHKVTRLYEMMIRIESEIPSTIQVDRLTCSECHITMAHAPEARESLLKAGCRVNGFPDEFFDRDECDRVCIECYEHANEDYFAFYNIYGKEYVRCGNDNCEEGNPFEGPDERPSKEVLHRFFKDPSLQHRSNLPDREYLFFPDDICSACFLQETRFDVMKHLNSKI